MTTKFLKTLQLCASVFKTYFDTPLHHLYKPCKSPLSRFAHFTDPERRKLANKP